MSGLHSPFSALFTAVPAAAGLPSLPTPGQFWAVVTWVILPGTLLLWAAYHQRRERLRQIHRRLRQLEARLAAATPAHAPQPAVVPCFLPPPSPSSRLRPNHLTARILLPASAATGPIAVFAASAAGRPG